MVSLSHIIPLVILFTVGAIFVYIAFHLYVWSNELARRADETMEQKHLSFSKSGGLRVGIKEVPQENVGDKAQNLLVGVWNKASFPNYKSRLGWNSTQTDASTSKSKSATTLRANPS